MGRHHNMCWKWPPYIIFIGVRIIKEMPGSVASGTHCISVTTFTSYMYTQIRGPGSSVRIATDYGLDGPGIESLRRRDFPPVQTDPGAQPASCTMGTRSFPGVKCGRGVLLTTHPLLAPWSWKSRAIPLPPSGSQPGLWRGHFTFYTQTHRDITSMH